MMLTTVTGASTSTTLFSFLSISFAFSHIVKTSRSGIASPRNNVSIQLSYISGDVEVELAVGADVDVGDGEDILSYTRGTKLHTQTQSHNHTITHKKQAQREADK